MKRLLFFAIAMLWTLLSYSQHPVIRAYLDEEGRVMTETVDGVPMPPTSRGSLEVMPGFPLSFGSNTTYKPARGVALADLDGDGADEILLSHNDQINVIDGQGQVRWTQTLAGGMAQYPPTVGDIDGDGDLEIVVLTAYGNARGGFNVYDHTGAVVFSQVTNNNPLICAPVLADLNNDGQQEILFCGRGKASANIAPGIHVWNLQGEELEGFPFELPGNPAFTPTVADIDGDGFLEIFACTTGILYCIDHTGAQVYSIDAQDAYKYSYQSPLVVDFEGEGKWSLVGACHGDNPHHYVRDAQTGEYREGWPKPVNAWTYSPPTVVRNGDRYAIFMGVSGEGNVFYQYDEDGNVAPGFPLNLTSGIEGFVSVADIDGDGENEIVTSFNLMEDGLGFIRAWEMDGTEVLDGFPLRPQGLTYMNGANFGDIDGDGQLEIVTLSYVQNFSPDDPVYVTAYALNQPKENLVYGTYKGSNDRTGWMREETVIVQCYPVENLTWETGGDCPNIGLFWDLPSETATGDLSSLQVYRDDELIATLPADETHFSDEYCGEQFVAHIYYIIALYSDGCEASSEPVEAMWIPDGVNEYGEQGLVYPNPCHGLINVAGAGVKKVEVFTLTGQLVLEREGEVEKIKVDHLNNGFYFVRLRSESGIQTLKIVIDN